VREQYTGASGVLASYSTGYVLVEATSMQRASVQLYYFSVVSNVLALGVLLLA
jgi:hypothetical protein